MLTDNQEWPRLPLSYSLSLSLGRAIISSYIALTALSITMESHISIEV